MKTLSTLFIFAFAFSGSFAQPVSGKLILGGNFSFSFEHYGEDNQSKSNSFEINPNIGFFITEKTAIGVRAGYSMTKDEYANSFYDSEKVSAFGLSPYFRYYIKPNKGGIFLQSSLQLYFGKEKTSYYDEYEMQDVVEESNFTLMNIGVSPGVYYYITEKIAIEATFGRLSYQFVTTKDEDDNKNKQNYFGLSLNPQSISFGVVFNL